MRFSIAVVAVMFAASAVADRGTLCFVEKNVAPKCQTTEGESIAIAAADADRFALEHYAPGFREVLVVNMNTSLR